MTASLALIALIALLQAGDVATTAIALRRGMTEANPVARALFGRLPMLPAAIAAKLLFTAPMVALAWLYPDWWPVPALYAASLIWVVVHNVRELRRERGT